MNGETELPRAFEEACAQSASAGLPSVVVEEWLEGREYSVNGWIESGVLASYCVTERITVPGDRPLGVMIAEVYPSGLSPDDESKRASRRRAAAPRRSGTGAAPATRRSASAPAAAFSSRPPRASAGASTRT